MTKTGEAASPPLEEKADSFLEWFRSNSRQVSIAAIVVVAAGLGTWLWRGAAQKKEANAGRSLSEAERAYGSGNMALAQSDLQRVLQRYGGTNAALQARIVLAQTYYSQKKPAEGLKVLDEVGNPGLFATSFHAVRAAGLEESGKNAEAAAEYLKASETALADVEKARYKADAARTYQAAQKLEEARKIWTELAADDANPLAGEARLRLGELTAKAASKG
jgi:predicted negative regulator of RcsB-dependent stress response